MGEEFIVTQNMYSVSFDSGNCMERIFEFIIDDCTLETFAFGVSYHIEIYMDDSEN